LLRRLLIGIGGFATGRAVGTAPWTARPDPVATVAHLRARLGSIAARSGQRSRSAGTFAGRLAGRPRWRRRTTRAVTVVVGLRTTVFTAGTGLGIGKRHRGVGTAYEQPRRDHARCGGDADPHSHVCTPPRTPGGRSCSTQRSASPIINDCCTIMVNCLLAL
jgi:hypothetical protein